MAWRETGSTMCRTALWGIIWNAKASSIGHLKAARETAGQNSTPKTVPFPTCTFPITHLICLPQFCITFVFHFSWVLQPSQEKWKQCLCKILGGKEGALWKMCKWRIPRLATSRPHEFFSERSELYKPRSGQASDGRRTFLKVYAISYNIDPGYTTKGNVNRELKQRRRWRQRERQKKKKLV